MSITQSATLTPVYKSRDGDGDGDGDGEGVRRGRLLW
jgi:hypothetical protein